MAEKINISSNKSNKKNINSHGYDVSKFGVLDMPVRRDATSGRLVFVHHNSKKKSDIKKTS